MKQISFIITRTIFPIASSHHSMDSTLEPIPIGCEPNTGRSQTSTRHHPLLSCCLCKSESFLTECTAHHLSACFRLYHCPRCLYFDGYANNHGCRIKANIDSISRIAEHSLRHSRVYLFEEHNALWKFYHTISDIPSDMFKRFNQ